MRNNPDTDGRTSRLRDSVESYFRDLPAEFREPDPDSPRGKILEAARTMFAQEGFDRTSTRSIAEQAGVNQAMIHYYFGSKERLRVHVVSLELLSLAQGLLRDLDHSRPPDELLIGIPLRIIETLRRDPVRWKLLRSEIARGGGSLNKIIDLLGPHGPRGLRPLWTELIREGQAQGRIRPIAPEILIPFLLSLSYGSLFLEPLIRSVLEIEDDEAAWKERLEGFASLLRHALQTEEARR